MAVKHFKGAPCKALLFFISIYLPVPSAAKPAGARTLAPRSPDNGCSRAAALAPAAETAP